MSAKEITKLDKRSVNQEREALIAQSLDTPEGRVALAHAIEIEKTTKGNVMPSTNKTQSAKTKEAEILRGIIETIPAYPANPANPAYPIKPVTPAQPIKSGFKTSEFWGTITATVVPSLITFLVWLNVVPDNLQTTLSNSVIAMVNGLITIIAVFKYIGSRKEIKIKYMQIEDNNIKRTKIENNNSIERNENNILQNKRFLLEMCEEGLIKPEALNREFNIPREFIIKNEKHSCNSECQKK